LIAMLSTRHRVQTSAALVGATAFLLAGCASGTEKADKSGEGASAAAESSPPVAAAPGNPAIGVSPGGVTTRIDEPAQSTEEQYAQSCLATKTWMDAKGSDAKGLVEPFLKELQSSNESGPATFNRTWSELSAAQQAAVIIAVEAAADGGC
jgi:hypothetical protein